MTKDIHLHQLVVPAHKRIVLARSPVGSTAVEWASSLIKAYRSATPNVTSITVVELEPELYFVMDGVRRCFAALQAQWRTIRAEVIRNEGGPLGEYAPLGSVEMKFG